MASIARPNRCFSRSLAAIKAAFARAARRLAITSSLLSCWRRPLARLETPWPRRSANITASWQVDAESTSGLSAYLTGRRVVSVSRMVGKPLRLANVPWHSTTDCGVVGMAGLEQPVQPAQPVMGDRREEVVGDVHILPVDEDRPARERVGEEDAGVGQPARRRRSCAGRRREGA